MKKPIRCHLGFHKKIKIGTQKVKKVMPDEFGNYITREIHRCENCSIIFRVGTVIGYEQYVDVDSLPWQPELSVLMDEKNFRKNKITKIMKKI